MCFPWWAILLSFSAGAILMLSLWLHLARIALRHRPWTGQSDTGRDDWDPYDDYDGYDEPCDYTVFGGNGNGTISTGDF